jgi:hypothetical protein
MRDPFTEAFAEAWGRPTPGKLVELLHPDVVLYQPHRPPVRGREEAYKEFNRLLAWLPGLHGVVHRSVRQGAIVFIEWQMKLPLGRRVASIGAVDRLRLETDELAIEREVYFDRMALLRALWSSPARWLGYLSYRQRHGAGQPRAVQAARSTARRPVW